MNNHNFNDHQIFVIIICFSANLMTRTFSILFSSSLLLLLKLGSVFLIHGIPHYLMKREFQGFSISKSFGKSFLKVKNKTSIVRFM